MAMKTDIKPLVAAISVALASGVFATPLASADQSLFSISTLASGYMSPDGHEGSCGGDKGDEEGKCGEDKDDEGKCGEDKDDEGKCGEDKGDKDDEGKCGEGKCGEDK